MWPTLTFYNDSDVFSFRLIQSRTIRYFFTVVILFLNSSCKEFFDHLLRLLTSIDVGLLCLFALANMYEI